MKRFTTAAEAALTVTLMGLVLGSCAGSDPVADARSGSDEARIQDCMKQASRSVCEMKIIGP